MNLGMVAQRVADMVRMEVQDVWFTGKYRKIVQARRLLCRRPPRSYFACSNMLTDL